MQSALNAVNAVKKSLPTSLVTSSVPALSAHVRKEHIEAGTEPVREFETARIEQAKRHEEILQAIGDIGVKARRRVALSAGYVSLDKEMDALQHMMIALSCSVKQVNADLTNIHKSLPLLEDALLERQKGDSARRVLQWNQASADQLPAEMATIEREYQQHYREALQNAFDEQMRQYRESGIAPDERTISLQRQRIEDVSLTANVEEETELEDFFSDKKESLDD